MKKKSFSRRDFLRLAGLATAGSLGACRLSQTMVEPTAIASAGPTYGLISTFSPTPPPAHTAACQPTLAASPTGTTEPTATLPPTETPIPVTKKTRVLRIAHMTDFHVQPEGNSPDGMVRALRHVHALADPPNVIFNTGDSVMETTRADRYKAERQWDTYTSILASENRIPIVHVLGNHDIWGWGLSDSSAMSDPMYGKEMAIARLGLPYRYYSFDSSGWHFIVLDSTQLTSPGSNSSFMGRLDEEQYQWFLSDVSLVAMTTNAPICILSHIPIMAACGFFSAPTTEASGSWVVPAQMMHIDARRLRDCFVQFPRIRLCLSGHTHQYESLEYLGVRYITSGAICGNWWNGAYMNFPPAYVMVNLYDDGSSDSEFVPYDEVFSVDKAIRSFVTKVLQ
jgi:Icc protein